MAVNDSPSTENIKPIRATPMGANTAIHEWTTPNMAVMARNTTP